MPERKVFISKEELEELYINQNLQRKEIAKLLNVADGTLKRWIQKFKIKKDSKRRVENIRKTCIERYNLPNGGWSPEAQKKIKQTNMEKYGSESYLQTDDYKEKTQKTLKEKYGENIINIFQTEECKDKIKKTNLERYGVESILLLEEIHEKSRQKCLEKYGVEYYWQSQEALKNSNLKIYGYEYASQSPKIKQKGIETKFKNNTFHTSKPEEEIYTLLLQKFPEVKRQYHSDLYPFACDFYVPVLDLYIEYQGTWTHGYKPYEGTQEDLEKVKLWESRNTTFYKNAIDVWTKRDVKKRNTAKENNLNWIEFFNMQEFMDWYNQQ